VLFYRKVLRILLHFEEVYEQSVNNGNIPCNTDNSMLKCNQIVIVVIKV